MKQDPGVIVIVGEALVDIFEEEIVVGGAPFNVARHLAGFGLHPTMVTRIGTDENGGRILAEFDRFGLSKAGVQSDVKYPTGHVLVRMSEGGHTFDIPSAQAFDRIDAEAALACLDRLKDVRYLYCGSLIRRSETSGIALDSVLLSARAPVFLDLNLRAAAGPLPGFEKTIGRPEVIKVNDEELQTLLTWLGGGRPVDISAQSIDRHRHRIAHLLREFGIALMIVTLGSEGAAVFDQNGDCLAREPGITGCAVVDTVGAGDAFSSVMLAGKMLGWPLATSLCRANVFAASVCGIRGAVPAGLDFYDRWIDDWFA